MSSLARRTLRTTAAAAGIAALGAGLAGNAVAAPAVDSDAPASGPTSGVQGATSALPLTGLPSASTAPGLSDLPMLFVFEAPTVYTSGSPSTPQPGTDALAGSQRVARSDAGSNRSGIEADDETGADDEAGADDDAEADRAPSPAAQDGALSALDTAGLFQGQLVDQRGYDVNTERDTDLN